MAVARTIFDILGYIFAGLAVLIFIGNISCIYATITGKKYVSNIPVVQTILVFFSYACFNAPKNIRFLTAVMIVGISLIVEIIMMFIPDLFRKDDGRKP